MPPRPLSLPCVILAAGFSRRMGREKLLLEYQGQPLLTHCLRAALNVQTARADTPDQDGASGVCELAPLLLVRGPHSPDFGPAIRLALGEAPSRLYLVTAEQAHEGQAESLKAGLSAMLTLCPDSRGLMVLLGDQPLVRPGLLRDLAALFFELDAAGEGACVAPAFAGKRGNPVVLHRDLFPEILTLTGDTGARALLARHKLRLLSCQDNACLTDVDSPEDYAALVE